MNQFHNILLGTIIAVSTPALWADELVMDVYKSPYCGCCDEWIKHVEKNGFKVTAHNLEDMQKIKTQYGIAPDQQSCHTGVIKGYFIEGHVPAQDIKKLLAEKPDIKGLTVPGMPAGSNVPGMETRDEKAKFDVLSVDDAGTAIYTQYE